MSPLLPGNTALLLIDLQNAIDHPSWGRRNNPDAEANIAQLLAAFRAQARPVVHVKHVSTEPHSTYRPDQAGCDFKDVAAPHAGETVLEKRVHSAFIGTGLETLLRERGWTTLVVVGVITNNSVEATVRMAADLGFSVVVVSDATFTFDRRDLEGELHPAERVHALSLSNLQGEYAAVRSAGEVLAGLVDGVELMGDP
ncbi:MAG: cysteine hydrolase family protein [Thermoanaerobaculia bacterium]